MTLVSRVSREIENHDPVAVDFPFSPPRLPNLDRSLAHYCIMREFREAACRGLASLRAWISNRPIEINADVIEMVFGTKGKTLRRGASPRALHRSFICIIWKLAVPIADLECMHTVNRWTAKGGAKGPID